MLQKRASFLQHQRRLDIERFDLLEYQQLARDMCCPKRLFDLWEDICKRYDRAEIGRYELDEMKEVIWPNLMALAAIRRSVNRIDSKPKQVRRRNSS